MDPLVRLALVGTRRAASLPATGTPVDGLSAGSDPAWNLLLRAGSLGILRRAARPAEAVPAAQPAPGGDRPCPAALEPLFTALLSGENPELLPEALGRLAAAGRTLPPALLPAALGRAEGRERLGPVLGARGRWLAGMNPEWAWCLEDSGPAALRQVWETGKTEERIGALTALRRLDPGEGLAWLREVWPSERAEVRALLLVGLAEQISARDEAFLEQCLDERSGRVRERAAALLRRIPNARLGQRMFTRLQQLLSWRPPASGLLERLVHRGPQLRVDLPEALTPDLARDGVGAASDHGLTNEAAWLVTMLAAVPPSRWSQRFGASAEAILAELPEHRWEVAEGWSAAACEQPDGDWLLALHAWWRNPKVLRGPARGRAEHWQDELIRALPRPEAERFALSRLREPTLQEAGRLASALERLQPEWPEAVARAWLGALRASVGQISAFSAQELLWWELSIADAPCQLPVSCLAEAVFPIPEQVTVRRWRTALDSFLSCVQRRQLLIRELSP